MESATKDVETILSLKDKLKIGTFDKEDQVVTSGVVISYRSFGKKLMFVDITNPLNFSTQTSEENILGLILKQETISSEFISKLSETLQKGTIILVKGYVEHSAKGQIILHAQSVDIQSHSQNFQEIATQIQSNRVKKRTKMETSFEEQLQAKKQKFSTFFVCKV